MPKKKPPAALSKNRPKLKVVKAPGKTAKGPIYQLKITLKDVKPPIWRRVQTQDCSLAELHNVIQGSMGWQGYHLHEFEIDGEQYGDPDPSDQGEADEPEINDEYQINLCHLLPLGVKKFKYIYDLGDGWEHTILIEKTVEAEPGAKYPRCVDGKRACPPEDCGGPWGYADLLETISDPKHEGHADMVEWIGRKFDAEAFDLAETNEGLAGL